MEDTQITEQEMTPQPIENIVQIDDGQMFTTSLIVAEAFEKNHFDVLKAIKNLECSPEFNKRNFAVVEYKDAKGEMRPAYRLTRDGFAFLAMGFTGKKAAAWKEKFLEAFNAMEQRLISQGAIVWIPPREPAATRKQRIMKLLRGHAAFWAFVDKIPYQAAELAVCAHVGIDRLENITEEGDGPKRIQAAFAYLDDVSSRPTGDSESDKASQNEIAMLKHMLEACGQWRYTRDQDFEQYFEEMTGVNLGNAGKLSSHDAEKMLAVAGCLLHQTHQRTIDWNEFAEDMAE